MSDHDQLQAILADAAKAGVYHLPHIDREPLFTAAEANGFGVFRIDLSACADKNQMLDAISQAMSFPDWFGHNLDALADCLQDLSWHPAEGYLVLLEHCDGIHSLAEDDFVSSLGVFDDAADEWREQGIAFWCFVDMQADGINWLPDV
jgi:RNAse (barnase) inhibitor barstar